MVVEKLVQLAPSLAFGYSTPSSTPLLQATASIAHATEISAPHEDTSAAPNVVQTVNLRGRENSASTLARLPSSSDVRDKIPRDNNELHKVPIAGTRQMPGGMIRRKKSWLFCKVSHWKKYLSFNLPVQTRKPKLHGRGEVPTSDGYRAVLHSAVLATQLSRSGQPQRSMYFGIANPFYCQSLESTPTRGYVLICTSPRSQAKLGNKSLGLLRVLVYPKERGLVSC